MQQDTFLELLNVLPTGIILAGQDGSVEYANPAALECLRWGRKNFKRLKIEGLLKLASEKKESIIRTQGKQNVPVRLSLNKLANGQWLIVVNDISEIHQLQKEILKMDRLASVGELTSGIAHEIRNPLAGIKTTAQALNEELPAKDHRRDYVARIIMEIDRLNKLLLNFFDFAKPKALNVSPCDLKKVIEAAVYMVRDTAQEHRIKVIELYPTKKVVLPADPDMIQQVIMNIFINAIQAMSGGGSMEIQLSEKNDNAEILISDTAKGIPENVRARIFDPFFTTKPKGIGLGLSISYRIIRMHSGSITFTSSSKGTIFRITLPKEPRK